MFVGPGKQWAECLLVYVWGSSNVEQKLHGPTIFIKFLAIPHCIKTASTFRARPCHLSHSWQDDDKESQSKRKMVISKDSTMGDSCFVCQDWCVLFVYICIIGIKTSHLGILDELDTVAFAKTTQTHDGSFNIVRHFWFWLFFIRMTNLSLLTLKS